MSEGAANDVTDWPWLADASGQRIALTAELRARRAGPFSLAQIRSAAGTISWINRYNGRLRASVPVDAHSLRVGRLARALLPEAEAYGLAHDLHEAWTGDETTPAEKDTALWLDWPAYREARIAQKFFLDSMIFPALGLQWPMPPAIAEAVRRADFLAFVIEVRDLGPESPRDARITAQAIETANRLHPERVRSIPLGDCEDRFWRALCVACPGLPRPEAA